MLKMFNFSNSPINIIWLVKKKVNKNLTFHIGIDSVGSVVLTHLARLTLDSISTPHKIKTGVPQGELTHPFPVISMCRRSGVIHHVRWLRSYKKIFWLRFSLPGRRKPIDVDIRGWTYTYGVPMKPSELKNENHQTMI